jgi:transcriptional regulator GlxA family with amidase domain
LQQDEFNCLGRYSDARAEQCTELQFLATDDPAQLGAFRTPSLRNVAARAPYMHTGQFSTLDQVIEHYARSPTAVIGHSELARPGTNNAERRAIRLSATQIQDIKAFLETLTGPVVELGSKQFEPMAPWHVRFHRDRPVIAVIAENSGTELVDFMVPYGVLARSGVADVIAVATREGAVTMRPALQIQPQATIAQFDARFPEGADYVIVPLVVQWKDPVLLGWVKAQAKKGSAMVSICDGAMVLAEAGLLLQRRATAHWASESMRRDMYRQTQWVNNARYVVDGPVASSAGISAALPMSLAIVEAIAGHNVAARVAGTLGTTDWSPVHDSTRFASGHGALFDALSAMQVTNRLFHSTQRIGIAVAPGVDEITLALTAEAYSRTGRSQAFAISDSPILTQHGLTILPSRIDGATPRIDVMLPAFDATPPAHIIDQALAGIATRYGRSTAYNVAAALEYPGFQK